MKIRLLCVGKLKERYWQDAVAEYSKRLSAYGKVVIDEVRESRFDDIDEEGKSLLERIRPEEHVITLQIDGTKRSSEELAGRIEALALHGISNLTFVIGGSCGLGKAISDRANETLSFSSMTFPHQMMRVILLEQLYRSFKINRNEPYHK